MRTARRADGRAARVQGAAVLWLAMAAGAGACRPDHERAEARDDIAPAPPEARPAAPPATDPAAPPDEDEGAPEAEREGEERAAPDEGSPRSVGVDRWWLTVADARGGAVLEHIDATSPAGFLLETGDVVTSADGRPIESATDLAAYLGTIEVGAPVLLELRRRGRSRAVGIQIAPAGDTMRGPAEPAAAAPPGAASPAPAPAAAPVPTVIIQVPAGAQQPVVLGGGGDDFAGRPPAYSAPGDTRLPGATLPPPPGPGAQTYPQLPGISQPPGWQDRPLRPAQPSPAAAPPAAGAPAVAPPAAGAPAAGAPGGPAGAAGVAPAPPRGAPVIVR